MPRHSDDPEIEEVLALRNRRIEDRIQQVLTTLYGVEGMNGLCRKVAEMDKRIDDNQAKLTAITAKWLMLMLLAAMVGNAVGGPVFKALSAGILKVP